MTELEKLWVVFRYEFLKHLRRKRLYVILGLTLLAELAVLVILPVLMDGYPDNALLMATVMTIGSSLATIGAVFFAGDAIAGEFESKTGFMLFTNPVKRTTLVFGKYLAAFMAVSIVIIFGYLITIGSLLAIYQSVPVETAESLGLCLLAGGAVVSVTFLFSAFSKGSMGATVISLVFIMVISPVIESVLMLAGEPSWFMISTAIDSVATVYGGYELLLGLIPAEQIGQIPFEFNTPDTGLCALAMGCYLVVCFVASVWISRRRQLS